MLPGYSTPSRRVEIIPDTTHQPLCEVGEGIRVIRLVSASGCSDVRSEGAYAAPAAHLGLICRQNDKVTTSPFRSIVNNPTPNLRLEGGRDGGGHVNKGDGYFCINFPFHTTTHQKDD